MDARELRIGNFLSGVIEDDQGEEKRLAVVVRGVDADSTLIDGTCKYSLTSLYGKDYEYYHDIEPIPLTEEWLVKFGFELEKTEGADWYFKEYEFGACGFANIGKTDLWFMYDQCRPIKHVHELQNLFYALTSQELKLKEQ